MAIILPGNFTGVLPYSSIVVRNQQSVAGRKKEKECDPLRGLAVVKPRGEWSERGRSRADAARLFAPELFLHFRPVPGRQEDFLRLTLPKDHPVRSLVRTTPPAAWRKIVSGWSVDRVLDRTVAGLCPGVMGFCARCGLGKLERDSAFTLYGLHLALTLALALALNLALNLSLSLALSLIS